MANQVVSSQWTIYHKEFTIYLNQQTNKITVATTIDGKQVSQSYNEPTLQLMDAVRLFKNYLITINGGL
jgi:hypothetical protein